MSRTEIYNTLNDVFRDVFDDSSICVDDGTTSSDVDGWDSLAQVLIVGELQNELGVKFTSAEVNSCSNVGEFVDAIMAKL